MKKLFFVFSFLFSCYFSSNAQTAAKSAYVELGGPGLASINYEMRLMKKEDGIGIRVGVGGFSIRSEYSNGYSTSTEKTSVLFLPLELNYLLGKDQKNYFEVGAGFTFLSARSKFSEQGYSDENDTFNSDFGHLYFGYRRQPKDGGFLFRAGICPVFGKGFFIPYYAGVSFGYKF
jgi:hypothetical protein